MSKSFYYQQSKKLIDYFNKKNINIRTRQQLKPNEFNTVKKKYVSKGSNINFWKKHTEKLQKLKKQVRISTKLKQQITAFKFVKRSTGTFSYVLKFNISQDKNLRRADSFTVNKPSTNNQIIDLAYELAYDKYASLFEHDTFTGTLYIYQSGIPEITPSIGQMQINDVQFFKINNIGTANDAKIKDNCVKYALFTFYGKAKYFTKKARKALDNIKDFTVDDFINYMKEYKLDYRLFYRDGKIYAENTENGYKVLHGYVANEHLYLMDKKDCDFLKISKNETIKDLKICHTVQKMIEDGITNKEIEHFKFKFLPYAKTYQFTECVFKNEGIKYTNNQALVDAFTLFKKVFSDHEEMTKNFYNTKFKIYSPFMKIAEYNKLQSTFTTFLNNPKPLLYNTGESGEYCIDKNKAYSWSLANLQYLPVINASSNIEPFDGKFNKENFYFVEKVINDSYGRHVLGWCSGFRIGNINDVVITKQIKPKLIKNPYTDIINKMAAIDQETTKNICNIFFGICQTTQKNNIVGKDIVKTPHGYNNDELIKCGGVYVVVKKIEEKTKYTENMRPIAHYIVDNLINHLFETINAENAIKKIIKLKTDSITYNGYPVNMQLSKNDFNGWKDEPVKVEKWKFTDRHREEKIIKEIGKKIDLNKNILFNCSAGSGKTHTAINSLIPKLEGKTMVISATCKALEEYYALNNINVSVFTIQYFMHGETLDYKEIIKRRALFRAYKNIIIDEFGLFDEYMMEYLYKMMGVNQMLYAFGDVEQLKPVKGQIIPLKNENIINTLFDYYHVLNKNWRNNFTDAQYEEMKALNYKLDNHIKPLINRLSMTNICYTNDTKEAINEQITQGWDVVFGERVKLTSHGKKEIVKMKIKKGGRIICISNKLKNKEIYNSQRFKIINNTTNDIKIRNIASKKDYVLKLEEFNKNFDYGYALTLYKIQGESVDINNLGIFDYNIISCDGKKLYTCLSRIKEELIKKPDGYNLQFYYKKEFTFTPVNIVKNIKKVVCKMINKPTRKNSIDFDDWLNNHTFGK